MKKHLIGIFFSATIISSTTYAMKNNIEQTDPINNKITTSQNIKDNQVAKSDSTETQNNLTKDTKNTKNTKNTKKHTTKHKKQLKKIAHNTSTGEYKIKSGDTLSSIAKNFKLSESCIMKTNKIKKKNKIIAGHMLKIPRNNCA